MRFFFKNKIYVYDKKMSESMGNNKMFEVMSEITSNLVFAL
eukprot:SAG11_NODE_31130_length_294_cov_1.179487_1_plen_40_part_01